MQILFLAVLSSSSIIQWGTFVAEGKFPPIFPSNINATSCVVLNFSTNAFGIPAKKPPWSLAAIK